MPAAPPPPRGDLSGGNSYQQTSDPHYQPNAPDNGDSKVQDFGLMGSGYRSRGYDVNQNAGYVGGSYGASQGQLDAYAGRAEDARRAAGNYLNQYGQGVGLQMDARNAQMAGLGYQQGGLGMTADAANMYRQMALGQGPSLAQLQLQQGLQQAQAQQASMAAGARGGGANLAAMQLGAATMAGQQAAGVNQQAAQIRAQEQLAAMQGFGALSGQYGQLAGQYGASAGAMRGQDLGYAGMAQQGIGMQQADALAYERMRQQQQMGELQAQTGLEQTQGQLATQTQGQIGQQAQEQAKSQSSTATGLIGAVGSLFRSDERVKTEKRELGTSMDSQLSKLRPYEYAYKDDPKRTRHVGILAQHMPSSTVTEIEGVKHVKVPEAVGFGLAALARLSDRVQKLEKKR